MLSPRNAWFSVIFWGWLRVPCLRYILIRLSSGANPVSSVSLTLPQSDTIQLTCARHHVNRASLDCTDSKTQTRGTREYSPLIYNLRHTVSADIALPMDHITTDLKCVEIALQFRLAKIAIYRSSAGVDNFRQLSVWFGIVSINVKLQNDERQRKEQHLWSTVLLKCAPEHASAQNLPFVFWKS